MGNEVLRHCDAIFGDGILGGARRADPSLLFSALLLALSLGLLLAWLRPPSPEPTGVLGSLASWRTRDDARVRGYVIAVHPTSNSNGEPVTAKIRYRYHGGRPVQKYFASDGTFRLFEFIFWTRQSGCVDTDA
ncbi:hypothetical protein AVEN_119327-1 [Araneus ventricosus]|uniref:Uncharacterized protein n=1 Tax=Araneus ventricosus TaxID=182803 RepID=A0A4Y2QGI7_ARAVE|nr:hypothetical protein AVEN_119327-1 [Araneus ventricosus]